MREPSWFGLPGRRAPAVPPLPGKAQSEVPGGKKRRVLPAAAIFPTELPKYREINRDPARDRKKAGHQNIAKNSECGASREIFPITPSLSSRLSQDLLLLLGMVFAVSWRLTPVRNVKGLRKLKSRDLFTERLVFQGILVSEIFY